MSQGICILKKNPSLVDVVDKTIVQYLETLAAASKKQQV